MLITQPRLIQTYRLTSYTCFFTLHNRNDILDNSVELTIKLKIIHYSLLSLHVLLFPVYQGTLLQSYRPPLFDTDLPTNRNQIKIINRIVYNIGVEPI